MGRKRKGAPKFEAWCWYCDREFEDEKVLLQHQRAKHYRCRFCPRRLNTAGGLTVHLHQVHKAEPTTIDNALPGRESFDIEIYGMVGIPEADLEEWQSRKAKGGAGGGDVNGSNRQRRPPIYKGVISKEDLSVQLEAHKALMSGKAPPPGIAASLLGYGVPAHLGFPPTNVPPPNMAYPPPPNFSRPPPPIGVPYRPPPPSQYSGPPPGYPPNTSLPPPTSASLPPPSAATNAQDQNAGLPSAESAAGEKVSRKREEDSVDQRDVKRERLEHEAPSEAVAEAGEREAEAKDDTATRQGRRRAADLF